MKCGDVVTKLSKKIYIVVFSVRVLTGKKKWTTENLGKKMVINTKDRNL